MDEKNNKYRMYPASINEDQKKIIGTLIKLLMRSSNRIVLMS